MTVLGKILSLVILLWCVFSFSVYGLNDSIVPVTPDASPEAKALLKLLYGISGKYTLTGQHNYPNIKGRNSKFASKYIGKTPVIYGTDWGFAKDSDTDSHLARSNIVEEAKKQHLLGSIITICWHAVPPTANEPVTFRPGPGKIAPDSLASVQGQLLDQQFKDLLTPGTRLYKHWCEQVDTIAFYLKKLQAAHVPILWRPFHEMNGSWFWWGGRRGEYSTIGLYRQLFDRLVNFHKINNLIWIWNVDRPNKPEMQFSNYYPGNKYLDLLSLDVYRNDFNQDYYDSLVLLSNGKPVILGEVGNPPGLEILKKQPKWASYVVWAGMVRNTTKKQYSEMVKDSHFLYMEDTVYLKIINKYRSACGLPSLPFNGLDHNKQKVDFSGEWIFCEEKSILETMGASGIPFEMRIIQNENEVSIQKYFILEYADDKITNERLTFDGKESKSELWNSPKIMKTKWSDTNDTMHIDSKVIFNTGGKISEMVINETWNLNIKGSLLEIKQFSNSSWGKRNVTLVFERIE